MARLTEKQKRFVAEYLVDLNATQAAVRAGYSANRASEIGYQLLQKTTVSDEIQNAMQKRSQRTEITQDVIVEKLAEIALGEATDFSVDGYPIVEGAKNKTSSQLKALELLGKHLGLFDGKNQQTRETENNLLQAIEESTKEDVETDDLPEVE